MGSVVGEAERRPKAENNGRSENPSDLPFENLPFHGLKNPPKKVQKNVVFRILQIELFIALFLVVYG